MSGEVTQAKLKRAKISSLLFLKGLPLPAPKNFRWVPEGDVRRGTLSTRSRPHSSLDVPAGGGRIAIQRSFRRGGPVHRSKSLPLFTPFFILHVHLPYKMAILSHT